MTQLIRLVLDLSIGAAAREAQGKFFYFLFLEIRNLCSSDLHRCIFFLIITEKIAKIIIIILFFLFLLIKMKHNTLCTEEDH